VKKVAAMQHIANFHFVAENQVYSVSAIAVQHQSSHIRASATDGLKFRPQERAMNNATAAKTRTSKPYSDPSSIEGADAIRDFAQQGASYSKDMYETTKAGAVETNRLMQQTYSAVAKSAADFNLQWIEMLRANTNSALDFSRELIGVKSPSELLELSAAHARKQFETFAEQTQQLTSLTQKVTTDAVGPMQTGLKNAFSKAA
jgi:phasin